MTFAQSPDARLDQVIRHVRHLLFAFDGHTRTAITERQAQFLDLLVACRSSGRSAAVISTRPQTEVLAYLDTYDLRSRISLVATSIGQAASLLKAPLTDCVLITSSPSDIQAAHAAGMPNIGYGGPREVPSLDDAGADASISSMTALTLALRAMPIGEES
jgi:beta-phosphoglucomutase-like phosphatase (HAD superfamily)